MSRLPPAPGRHGARSIRRGRASARPPGDVASVAAPDLAVFRLDRPGIRMVLGDLEAEIMELLWARPAGQGTTVREVFDILHARRRCAYTTVMTTMARMARKRLLRVQKDDQAYVYEPTLDREAFVSRLVGRILEDLLLNFSGPTLASLETLVSPEPSPGHRRYAATR